MKEVLGVVLAAMLVASLFAADLTGAWALEFQTEGSSNVYRGECTLDQEGERLSGSCASGWEPPVPVTGSVKGKSATFRFRTGIDAGFTATFSGQLDAEETTMTGTMHFVDQAGNEGTGTFTAVRQ